MDATALVETDFFATAVLETTRTPVKEVVKADMSAIDSFPKVTTRARAGATDRPRVEGVRTYVCERDGRVCANVWDDMALCMMHVMCIYIVKGSSIPLFFLSCVCRVIRRRGRSVGR